MAEVLRPLSNGKIMRFDSTEYPIEVIDRVIAYENAKLENEKDSYLQSAGKTVKTIGRGLGEGVAQTVDLPFQAGQYAFEVGKNLWEEAQGRPYERKSVASPATDEYNRLAGDPIPGYEGINDWTAVLGPAVVESVATLGAGAGPAIGTALARQGARAAARETAKQAGSIAVRAPARAAGTTAVGIGAAEGGAALGEAVGGDVGKEIGGGVGGLLSGAVAPATKAGARKAFAFDKDSEGTLAAIQRLNDLGADIPITGGILSPKRLGPIEDRLARNLIGSGGALETRRGQYAGLDRALQLIAAKVRGSESGGPISKETIGNDIIAMMGKADETIGTKMENLQNALEQQAGKLSETDAMKIDRALVDLTKNKGMSAALRDQAGRLRAELQKNYEAPPLPGVGHNQGPPMQGPSSPTMTYGATKDVRSDIGSSLPDETLGKKVKSPAYAALSDMMREAQIASGGALDFDQQQQIYQAWKKQQKAVQEKRGTRTGDDADVAPFQPEGGAYTSLLGGGQKGSTRQLAPYEEHTPQALDEILADALELETRGPNAGRGVDPETFDPKLIAKNYDPRSPEWKQKVTRQGITEQGDLEAVHTVAQAENARAGKRSVPGASGSSTFGEGLFQPGRVLTAGGAGAVGGIPGFVAGMAAPPAYNLLKSKLLTNNEAGLTRLFQKEPLHQTAGRAATGAAQGAKATNQQEFEGTIGSTVRINDPDSPDNGVSGRVVEVGRGMVRFLTPEGELRQIGKNLLTLEEP